MSVVWLNSVPFSDSYLFSDWLLTPFEKTKQRNTNTEHFRICITSFLKGIFLPRRAEPEHCLRILFRLLPEISLRRGITVLTEPVSEAAQKERFSHPGSLETNGLLPGKEVCQTRSKCAAFASYTWDERRVLHRKARSIQSNDKWSKRFLSIGASMKVAWG
jgi:hypothetical protein